MSQAAAGGRINVVLKSGASSLLVRDALRRPLAELELGEVSAGLSRSSPAVMQVMGACPRSLLKHHREL